MVAPLITNHNYYSLLVAWTQYTADRHSSFSSYVVCCAVALSFFGLILKKLYISLGALQLYFIRFALERDVVSLRVTMAINFKVILCCNLLVVVFVAMDEQQLNTMKRYQIESIIVMMLLIASHIQSMT